jgi:hypothetical protein
MPSWCPKCGRNIEEDEKFCRQCGMPQHLAGEEAATWMLTPQPEPDRGTAPVQPGPTAPTAPPTGAAYIPPTPTPYYPPPYPAPYQPPPPAVHSHIALGDWLSGGWQIYKENAALMSLATVLGGLLSVASVGILAGPLLMGMLRMAFKTMRGERPNMGDLFSWQGRFLQAFVTFLIFALVHVGLTGLGGNSLHGLLSLVVTPLLTVMLGLTMSSILERGLDVARAINEAARVIFSKDAVMWWVTGLVFSAISFGGTIACGIGVFVTLPWMIAASAVAYRDIFDIDDPNRTLH